MAEQSPSNKRRKLNPALLENWTLSELFCECGILNKVADDLEKSTSSPLILDHESTPSSFKSSFQALLRAIIDHSDEESVTDRITESLDALIDDNKVLYKLLSPLRLMETAALLSMRDSSEDGDLTQVGTDSIANGNGESNSVNTVCDTSLVKILTKIELVQTPLLTLLLQKLPILSNSASEEGDQVIVGDVTFSTIAHLIVSHIRWLDPIYNPNSLTETALQCLTLLSSDSSVTDEENAKNHVARNIQLDLISLLPDVTAVSSGNHSSSQIELIESVFDALRQCRDDNPSLMVPCLDALTTLPLSEDQQTETVNDVIDALSSADREKIPAITRFLMQHINSEEACNKVIEEFRNFRLRELTEENEDPLEVKSRNNNMDVEALTLEALAQGMQYRPEIAEALLKLLKKIKPSNHGAADLWLLFCCAQSKQHVTRVVSLLKAKAAVGAFHSDIIREAIQGNGQALGFLFHSVLVHLCDALVRSPENSTRELGSVFYYELFFEFSEPLKRQEIVGSMVTHIGSDSSKEVNSAMDVLRNIAVSSEGARFLRPYAPFLTSLLDFIQKLTIPQIRSLYVILFSVGSNQSSSSSDEQLFNTDFDEVQIVIRKYLSLGTLSLKKIGIIGSVAYAVVASNSFNQRQDSTSSEDAAVSSNKEALKPIKEALKSAYKQCQNGDRQVFSTVLSAGSQYAGTATSFFFDELACAIRYGLKGEIREWIFDHFSPMLEEEFIGEFAEQSEGGKGNTSISSEWIPVDSFDVELLQGALSSNPRSSKGALRLNIDKDEASIYLRLFPLLLSKKRSDMESSAHLCSLLCLLAACSDPRYGGGGLSEIDAVVGCGLLLADAKTIDEKFDDFTSEQQVIATLSIYYACCWCRELVNCFMDSAVDEHYQSGEMRKKVIERLNHIVELQDSLEYLSRKSFDFAPFGMAPLPLPKGIFTNSSQDGNDDSVIDESVVETHNTQKTEATLAKSKKKTAKIAAQKEKERNTRIKIRVAHEAALRKRCMDSLRPFNFDVCKALGFSELGVLGANPHVNGTMMSVGPSQFETMTIGNPLVCMLLRELLNSFEKLFDSGKDISFPGRLSKIHINNGNNSMFIVEQLNIDSGSAYLLSSGTDKLLGWSKSDVRNTLYEYIGANVFASLYEYLSAFASVRAGHDDDDDCSDGDNFSSHQKYLTLLYECIEGVVSAKDLTSTNEGLLCLEKILIQLSKGERFQSTDQAQPKSFHDTANLKSIVNALGDIFELISETLCIGMVDDLEFVMKGVSSLEAISECAQRIEVLYNKEEESISKCSIDIMQKMSKVCYDILQSSWGKNEKFNKSNVGVLLSCYIRSPKSSTSPTKRLKPLNHLANNILAELLETSHCRGPAKSFPTLTLKSFPVFFSAIFSSLPSEMIALMNSDGTSSSDKIGSLESLTDILYTLNMMVREHSAYLSKSSILLIQLKNGTKFIETFISKVIPFFQENFLEFEKKIVSIIGKIQKSTRILTAVVGHSKRNKDAFLAKEAPKARKAIETFMHKVKSLMKKNNRLDAFSGGFLVSKNIDGSKVTSVVTTKKNRPKKKQSNKRNTTGSDDEESNDASSSSGKEQETETEKSGEESDDDESDDDATVEDIAPM